MKKIIPILKPVIRGAIKSLPMGNVITEVIANAKDNTGVKPHNWVSIGIQFLCVGAIVYAFATHAISLDELLKDLGFSK